MRSIWPWVPELGKLLRGIKVVTTGIVPIPHLADQAKHRVSGPNTWSTLPSWEIMGS